jgi:hypothetical protein
MTCQTGGGEGLPPGRRPSHPPRPLQPAYLDLLFVLDTSVFMSGIGDMVIVEVLRAGTLRMPSGRLIAADPAWIPREWLPGQLDPFCDVKDKVLRPSPGRGYQRPRRAVGQVGYR